MLCISAAIAVMRCPLENDTATATAVIPAGTGEDSGNDVVIPRNGEGSHGNAVVMGITATVMLQ